MQSEHEGTASVWNILMPVPASVPSPTVWLCVKHQISVRRKRDASFAGSCECQG